MTMQLYPHDFVDLAAFAADKQAPLGIDLLYAKADHPLNIFKTAIYKPDATLWLHRDLADIVIHATFALNVDHGWQLVATDGLRPVEAQMAMAETEIVKANPHWVVDGPNRMLSLPGTGGHPRGMAVDLMPLDSAGHIIDMGTVIDQLTPDPAHNPAARAYKNLPDAVLENRQRLERAMCEAAAKANLPLYPLPSEWWDFRFPSSHYDLFDPVYDRDLPAEMQIMPS